MIYGSTQYWQEQCDVFPLNETSFWQVIVSIGQCDAWVAWVCTNAMLHFAWVLMLFACQVYQVRFVIQIMVACMNIMKLSQIAYLGMTTNERMNRGRYTHFINNNGNSPFSRSFIQNLADFLECNCCGLVSPRRTDWMTSFDLEKNVEHQPLLRQKDNFQYV